MAKKPRNSPEITARKRAEGKNLGGRPRFNIDYKQLEKLCEIFCTAEECAAILGTSRDTLSQRLKEDYLEELAKDPEKEPETRFNGFPAYFKKMSSKGKESLRRKQFEMATGSKPDKGMLIWLGKNYLEQSDRIDHTTKGNELPAATGIDFTNLSDDEFKTFGELVKKAKAQNPDKNTYIDGNLKIQSHSTTHNPSFGTGH